MPTSAARAAPLEPSTAPRPRVQFTPSALTATPTLPAPGSTPARPGGGGCASAAAGGASPSLLLVLAAPAPLYHMNHRSSLSPT